MPRVHTNIQVMGEEWRHYQMLSAFQMAAPMGHPPVTYIVKV
jgi:hypothetical protein